MRAHLEEGLGALLEVAGSDAVMICESNSLRRVAEPALFFMVRGRRQVDWKESAREVAELADRIVTSDGRHFDFDIDRVKSVDGKWTMQLEATAIIMAGGQSARIGRDKSMLPIDGEPMIKYVYERLCPDFDKVIVSADDAGRYGFLGVEVVEDRVAGRGPLMGIASALRASTSAVNFVIGCDIPEFDMRLVRRMVREVRDYDAVIPRTGEGQYEPVFAVYKKSAVDAIEEALTSGKTRVMEGLEGCKVKYMEVAADERPRNINTMADYRAFVER
jgi:molybdopterin-guanine dinucleotide biosynthesis protein A